MGNRALGRNVCGRVVYGVAGVLVSINHKKCTGVIATSLGRITVPLDQIYPHTTGEDAGPDYVNQDPDLKEIP